MSKIQRLDYANDGILDPMPNGRFISYTDYTALQSAHAAELEAKDREIERLRESYTGTCERVSDYSNDCEQLRSQLTAAEATIAELRNRLRKTCQTLVEAVGADGPCDAEEAASRAVSQVERLTRERDEAKLDHGDFLAFMAAELDGFPCCHGPAGNGAHAATPPMMWPELVSCIAANAKRELQDKLTAAEQSRDKAEQSLAEVRRVLDAIWDESQGDKVVINHALIMQVIVNKLRQALAQLDSDSTKKP